jgi:hypothetical protein
MEYPIFPAIKQKPLGCLKRKNGTLIMEHKGCTSSSLNMGGAKLPEPMKKSWGQDLIPATRELLNNAVDAIKMRLPQSWCQSYIDWSTQKSVDGNTIFLLVNKTMAGSVHIHHNRKTNKMSLFIHNVGLALDRKAFVINQTQKNSDSLMGRHGDGLNTTVAVTTANTFEFRAYTFSPETEFPLRAYSTFTKRELGLRIRQFNKDTLRSNACVPAYVKQAFQWHPNTSGTIIQLVSQDEVHNDWIRGAVSSHFLTAKLTDSIPSGLEEIRCTGGTILLYPTNIQRQSASVYATPGVLSHKFPSVIFKNMSCNNFRMDFILPTKLFRNSARDRIYEDPMMIQSYCARCLLQILLLEWKTWENSTSPKSKINEAVKNMLLDEVEYWKQNKQDREASSDLVNGFLNLSKFFNIDNHLVSIGKSTMQNYYHIESEDDRLVCDALLDSEYRNKISSIRKKPLLIPHYMKPFFGSEIKLKNVVKKHLESLCSDETKYKVDDQRWSKFDKILPVYKLNVDPILINKTGASTVLYLSGWILFSDQVLPSIQDFLGATLDNPECRKLHVSAAMMGDVSFQAQAIVEAKRLEKEQFEKEQVEKEQFEKEQVEKEQFEKEQFEKEQRKKNNIRKKDLEKELIKMEQHRQAKEQYQKKQKTNAVNDDEKKETTILTDSYSSDYDTSRHNTSALGTSEAECGTNASSFSNSDVNTNSSSNSDISTTSSSDSDTTSASDFSDDEKNTGKKRKRLSNPKKHRRPKDKFNHKTHDKTKFNSFVTKYSYSHYKSALVLDAEDLGSTKAIHLTSKDCVIDIPNDQSSKEVSSAAKQYNESKEFGDVKSYNMTLGNFIEKNVGKLYDIIIADYTSTLQGTPACCPRDEIRKIVTDNLLSNNGLLAMTVSRVRKKGGRGLEDSVKFIFDTIIQASWPHAELHMMTERSTISFFINRVRREIELK